MSDSTLLSSLTIGDLKHLFMLYVGFAITGAVLFGGMFLIISRIIEKRAARRSFGEGRGSRKADAA